MVYSKHELFDWSDAIEARAKMTRYIRHRFADLLGDDAALLDLPNGLELLQDKVRARIERLGLAAERFRAAA